jgi:uncharacterized membrane protein HdeD (DUF308 family)
MPVILEKNWWSLVLRGFTAIVLASVLLSWTELPIDVLALVFAGYLVFDGLAGLAGALRAAEAQQRWAELVAEGILDLVTAILLFARPDWSSIAVLYVIAVWALATGAMEFLAAVRLRRCITGEWLLAVSGAASLILGALLVAAPLASTRTVAIAIATYALIFGILLIVLGFRLRWRASLIPAE